VYQLCVLGVCVCVSSVCVSGVCVFRVCVYQVCVYQVCVSGVVCARHVVCSHCVSAGQMKCRCVYQVWFVLGMLSAVVVCQLEKRSAAVCIRCGLCSACCLQSFRVSWKYEVVVASGVQTLSTEFSWILESTRLMADAL